MSETPPEKPIKLYVVTVTREYVYASTFDSRLEVMHEFEGALLAGEFDDDATGDEISAAPMTYMPAEWDADSIPYGSCVEGDTTVGQLIEAGAAPEYTKALDDLRAFATQHGKGKP